MQQITHYGTIDINNCGSCGRPVWKTWPNEQKRINSIFHLFIQVSMGGKQFRKIQFF